MFSLTWYDCYDCVFLIVVLCDVGAIRLGIGSTFDSVEFSATLSLSFAFSHLSFGDLEFLIMFKFVTQFY
ncbi:hypothetical protein ARMGADRAFT_1021794 [Armillaria gallica]|uniref:Uncharacterized protein n=1 Tax=Armillaria gallica TaxID=47427 RepID=A0A2H3C7A1_ARMGA|nr:hypothetical protein ARMGADRAFT_1021794 [Armillaria gallica]